MLLNEVGNRSRRPAGEISDGVGDRDCLSARALIDTDREKKTFCPARGATSRWALVPQPKVGGPPILDRRKIPIEERAVSKTSGPRAGLVEINLPALQPGSSIMPVRAAHASPEKHQCV